MTLSSNQNMRRRNRARRTPRRLAGNSAMQTQFSVPRRDADYYRLSIVKNAFPLPKTLRTTLPYYEQVNLVNNTTPFIYVFRLNGCFDPNQTGTGAQPVGWDNLLTFYNQSFCVGSRIEITLINNSTTPIQFGVAPTIASSSLSSFDAMTYYNRNPVFGEADGTGRGGKSVVKRFNSQALLDFYGQPYSNDFIAYGNALPTRNAFWTIALQSADQTALVNANLQVRIFYDVVFMAPVPVALS